MHEYHYAKEHAIAGAPAVPRDRATIILGGREQRKFLFHSRQDRGRDRTKLRALWNARP